MLNYFRKSHIYTAHEMQRASLSPLNFTANILKECFNSPFNPMGYTEYGRSIAASCELIERFTRKFSKPEFNIESVIIDNQEIAINQEIVTSEIFCDLIRFRKKSNKRQKKLLIVAPLSGHYATLLRGTVEGLLPYFDVYITDWTNASDVPLSEGKFDLDDYIEYVQKFLKIIGKDTNIMAVCQPAVPVLAAVALMSGDENPYLPKTMTLIGGPIDTRKKPTEVNNLAKEKSYEWFKREVISNVPANYAGFMRSVYPGFIQLSGFMSMNLNRHIDAHKDLFNHLIEGDGESAIAHKKFYNEYLSVMDIPAEFYLQTIKTVFQEHLLPKGKMIVNGRKVDPSAIKNTAILAIEGERDDISGIGQTAAALDICTSVAKSKKKYHLQKNVGHYGLFNGKRFNNEIVPVIDDFIAKHG